jgi:hypothetical protein
VEDKNLRVNRKWLMKVGAAVAFYAGLGLAYLVNVAQGMVLGVGSW